MSTPIRPATEGGANLNPGSEMPPKPEKASLVEDFIDIFYAPSQVFARRANASFWMPLLIIAIVSAAFAFANRNVFAAIFDAEFARGAAKAMAQNPQITPEAMATMRGVQEKIVGFMGYIGTPLFIFVVAIMVWLAAKIVSAKVTYGQAVLITTFAWIPRLVQGLLTTVQMLLLDTANITSMHSFGFSPARFVDRDSMPSIAFNLLGRLDLFTIWLTILIGIGIAVIGNVPRSKGYIAAAIVFVLGTIPALFSGG